MPWLVEFPAVQPLLPVLPTSRSLPMLTQEYSCVVIAERVRNRIYTRLPCIL